MQAKAVYAVEKDVVKVQEFELDETAMRPDQLLVRTRYSLISPGTELDCISGKESSWFHFPQQLGYCAVGEVLAVGAQVSRYVVGDPVMMPTPHASYAVIDEASVRARIPDGLDLRLAVWAHIAVISITALRASSAELGDCVVVLGQGLIGNIAAQLFQAQGCRVIAVDRLAARLDIARRCGVEMVVDASSSDAVAAVRQLTHDRGAEVVVEASGSPAAALLAFELAARNGEVILLGTPRGRYEADVVPLLRAVHRASPNLTIKGAHGGSLPPAPDPFVKHSVARNAEIVLDMIRRAQLKLDPLLSAVVRPDAAAGAYRELRDHPDRAMGIVMDWS